MVNEILTGAKVLGIQLHHHLGDVTVPLPGFSSAVLVSIGLPTRHADDCLLFVYENFRDVRALNVRRIYPPVLEGQRLS